MKNVLSLDAKKAREFFLKHESYCNFDLPPYFKFQGLLNVLSTDLTNKNLSDFYLPDEKPWDFEDVNYKLVSNKDGRYAWRPLQLIHPALYVNLVHVITETKNWNEIQNRFSSLMAENRSMKCESLPVLSHRYKKDKAEQISHWVDAVERKSITYAMDYDYVLHTDVTDCYGSIYTHSIAWALHGKDEAKEKKGKKGKDRLLGDVIDEQLRAMTYGQTNGIPQGSVLMDFIAELVLCYADKLLSERIGGFKKTQYKVIRYRDDYRIFTYNSQVAEQIIKELTDVLHGLGLKINSTKTKGFDNVVHSSIKEDKLHWIVQGRTHSDLRKELLAISVFSESFPNSGQLSVALQDFYNRVSDLQRRDIRTDVPVLISILVDIAYKNPRTYPIAAAIISKLIDLLPGTKRVDAMKKILRKFKKLPNTGIMQIWLHRITIKLSGSYIHSENLCGKVLDNNTKVWNSDWLQDSMRKKIDICDVIDQAELERIGAVIGKDEVELFTVGEYPF